MRANPNIYLICFIFCNFLGQGVLASQIIEVDYSVVRIFAVDQKGSEGTGSGFVINSNGLIVTNYHVVDSAEEIFVVFKGHGGEPKIINAEILVVREDLDLAVLRMGYRGLSALKIRSNALNKAETVFAIGYPALADLGLFNKEELSEQDMNVILESSMTKGILSRVVTFEWGKLVQHSAILANGNSGGPLVDYCGQVIGVNSITATEKTQSGDRINASGFGYAIHGQTLINFLKENSISFEFSNQSCIESTGETEQRKGGWIANQIYFGLILLILFIILALFMVFTIKRSSAPAHQGHAEVIGKNVLGSKKWMIQFSESISEQQTVILDSANVSRSKPFIIGRSSSCNFVILDEAASRRHLMLFFEGNDLFCQDLNSSNGSKLNRRQISSSRASKIISPAEILIGRLGLTLVEID